MAYLIRFGSALAGVGVVLGLLSVAPEAMAQSTDPASQPRVDPNSGFSSPDAGGGVFDDSSGPMDLIHRAILMNEMSLDEFRSQQQGRMSTEAANFRQMQQRAIQERGLSTEADGSEAVPVVDE